MTHDNDTDCRACGHPADRHPAPYAPDADGDENGIVCRDCADPYTSGECGGYCGPEEAARYAEHHAAHPSLA